MRYAIKERLYFSFCNNHAATILAEAQIMVPFHPRHAHNASDHHRNVASTHAGCHAIKLATTGSITAVNGILSKNAENIAETHRITRAQSNKLLPKLS